MKANELPVISLMSADWGREFAMSLSTFGFAALVDHPLDMQRVTRIYDQWRGYFAAGIPPQFAQDGVQQDGYFSVGEAEHAKGYSQRDYKEYFQYYPWGRCPASLAEDLSAHYAQSVSFAAALLNQVEINSPEKVSAHFSEPLHAMISDSQQSMLRVLHYPPIQDGRRILRAAPHEDINLLTILPAADGPGLEIRTPDGVWLSVPNRPDQVLVNVGDMLQELSQGYFPSTTHQVAVPTGEALAAGRMSLPLFLHPRPEVVLSSRYTAAAYLRERLQELGVASA